MRGGLEGSEAEEMNGAISEAQSDKLETMAFREGTVQRFAKSFPLSLKIYVAFLVHAWLKM